MSGKPDVASCAAQDVQAALAEDLGSGDLLAGLVGSDPKRARIETRTALVLAGGPWCEAALAAVCGDEPWECTWACREGERQPAGATLAVITAPGDALLAAERTMLNFLHLLSGVATAACEIADAAGGTPVYDTRKTLPGLRQAQKYAVQFGGFRRNRSGLHDAAIVKDNHIAAAGSVAAALEFARRSCAEDAIQVEVADMRQLQEALAAGARRVMLDNFSPEQAREAVAAVDGKAEVEASGGITAANAAAYAAAGVDRLSSGAPTQAPQRVDISLMFEG